MRWSTMFYILVFLLLVAWSGWSALQGLVLQARLWHASDVYRDHVMEGFNRLIEAGAVDSDRLAAAVGVQAFTGSTAEERARWESDVRFRSMFVLTDALVDDVESEWARNSQQWFVASAVGVLGAGALCALLVGRARRAAGSGNSEAPTDAVNPA